MDDSDSIGKNSLYHEPFNVNMYTSGVNGYAAVNDLQCNMTPDYTGKITPSTTSNHIRGFTSKKMDGWGNKMDELP